ncbi:hypothetical protein BH24ACT5_BH24ACT5_07020 [soil metagenome]
MGGPSLGLDEYATMSAGPADDVRDWVSFADPTEERTWVFDVTFLRSNYMCIFGEGCHGILDDDATDMAQGCCSYGAHLVDEDDVANVVRHFVRLEPRHMQFHAEATTAGFLDREDVDEAGHAVADGAAPTGESVTVTRQVDDACIFLNRPGSEQGPGCALHVAALEAGERPLDWKPNVCWQVPIRLEHSTDENGHVTSRLRDWKRRDWGEGGEDFHWWCTESAEAFVGSEPVYVSARDEITELVGADVYGMLVDVLERGGDRPAPRPVTLRARRHAERR